MRPEFGCGIHDYVFAGGDARLGAAIAVEVRKSLLRWEPRVIIEDVDVTARRGGPALLYIDVRYRPKATNDPRNLVFPFYTIPSEGERMTLPVPNLDDRRFQDLVDEAKRMVQQRCPEWTDHNVSDPGVTLIETFAWMTDQLVYRLNRVPDRLYVKFLELIGVRLFPPTPARAPLTFWLAAPPEATCASRAGTAGRDDPHRDRARRSSSRRSRTSTSCRARSRPSRRRLRSRRSALDRTEELQRGGKFAAFAAVPKPGDALLIGLSEAVPRCAVRLRMRCTIEGRRRRSQGPAARVGGVGRRDLDACEVDGDATGGPEPRRRRGDPRRSRARRRGASTAVAAGGSGRA